MPARMYHLFKMSEQRYGSLHQSGQVSRRQRTSGDAAWEDRGGLTRDHLDSGNHKQQASQDREPRRYRDQSDEEHDDSKGALVQAIRQLGQGEVIGRYLIMQRLQHDGSRNKRSRVGRQSRH
jgi:hypothetical protein